MTNRHQGYIVILADDLREDDAAATLNALRMVRGVMSVEPIVANGGDLIARARETERWRTAIVKLTQFGPDCVRAPYEEHR
jgi:hypothetical protein